MCQEQICPSNAIYMPDAKITWCALMGKYVNIYTTYELNSIKHVTSCNVQRHQWWCQWQCSPSPVKYTELATWPNLSKNDWFDRVPHLFHTLPIFYIHSLASFKSINFLCHPCRWASYSFSATWHLVRMSGNPCHVWLLMCEGKPCQTFIIAYRGLFVPMYK